MHAGGQGGLHRWHCIAMQTMTHGQASPLAKLAKQPMVTGIIEDALTNPQIPAGAA